VDLQSSLSTIERQKELESLRKEAEVKKQKESSTKIDLYKRLKLVIGELTTLGGDHLQSTPQVADAGFLVPAALRPTQVFAQEMTQYQQMSQINLLRAQVALGKGEGTEKIGGQIASSLEVKVQPISASTLQAP